jgi:predicted phage-related endonuclease
MIKCSELTCNNGKGNICCCECNNPCKDCCEEDPKTCGGAIVEEHTTDVAVFQSKALVIMQTIAALDLQKKQLEAQDKEMRQQLQEAMDKYGVKKFENDILKITYVEPTMRTTIDSKKLKEELPAVAEKYTKRTLVKGSVRIEVK